MDVGALSRGIREGEQFGQGGNIFTTILNAAVKAKLRRIEEDKQRDIEDEALLRTLKKLRVQETLRQETERVKGEEKRKSLLTQESLKPKPLTVERLLELSKPGGMSEGEKRTLQAGENALKFPEFLAPGIKEKVGAKRQEILSRERPSILETLRRRGIGVTKVSPEGELLGETIPIKTQAELGIKQSFLDQTQQKIQIQLADLQRKIAEGQANIENKKRLADLQERAIDLDELRITGDLDKDRIDWEIKKADLQRKIAKDGLNAENKQKQLLIREAENQLRRLELAAKLTPSQKIGGFLGIGSREERPVDEVQRISQLLEKTGNIGRGIPGGFQSQTITEADIQTTMRVNGLSREEVLKRLGITEADITK